MCAFSTHAYGEMGSSRRGVNFILFQIHLTIIFLRLNARDKVTDAIINYSDDYTFHPAFDRNADVHVEHAITIGLLENYNSDEVDNWIMLNFI